MALGNLALALTALLCVALTAAFGFTGCSGGCAAPGRTVLSTVSLYLFLAVNTWMAVAALCCGGRVLRVSSAAWVVLFVAGVVTGVFPPVPFLAPVLGVLVAGGLILAWLPSDATAPLTHRVVVGLVALALVGLPAAQPKLGSPFFKGEQEFSPTGLAAGRLNVLSLSGEETVLDLKKKPAVLVATWCGGCDEVLEAVASLAPSKRPYIVGVYLDRTRLGEEKEKLEEKVRQIVPESEIYLLLDPPPVRGVPGFLFVQDNGRIVAGDTTESVKGLLGLWATELSNQIPLAEERSIPRAAAEKTG